MTGSRIQAAVADELAKLARAQSNIDRAATDGHLSEHDAEERKARAEQWTANRIAFLSGQPRPAQRARQPLDDPQAGVVG